MCFAVDADSRLVVAFPTTELYCICQAAPFSGFVWTGLREGTTKKNMGSGSYMIGQGLAKLRWSS